MRADKVQDHPGSGGSGLGNSLVSHVCNPRGLYDESLRDVRSSQLLYLPSLLLTSDGRGSSRHLIRCQPAYDSLRVYFPT